MLPQDPAASVATAFVFARAKALRHVPVPQKMPAPRCGMATGRPNGSVARSELCLVHFMGLPGRSEANVFGFEP